MGASVEYGNRCDENDQLPRGSKNTSQRRKGDVKTDVYRRLSVKDRAAIYHLKDLSPINEGDEDEAMELIKKAHDYDVSSHSSDETVSLSDSKSSATSESITFTRRSPNVSELRARTTRHRSRSSSPFHTRSVSLLCHDTTEADERPAEKAAIISTSRSRAPSPFYEKLAYQHTKAFAERLRQKPSLPTGRQGAIRRVPFYRNVHPSNDFPDGSEVHAPSSIKKRFRFPTPPPSRRRFDKNSADTSRGPRRSSFSSRSIHEILASSTETKASTFKKGPVKDCEQKQKVTHLSLRKQDALFHRLSKLDTVASARRKPSPSRVRGLTPYELSLKKEEFRNRKPPMKSKSSVHDRQSMTTVSWRRQQKIETNRRFKSEYETFEEMRKIALMRNFEGSTRVKM